MDLADSNSLLRLIEDAGYVQDVALQLILPWHSAFLGWAYWALFVLSMLGAILLILKKVRDPMYRPWGYQGYIVYLLFLLVFLLPVKVNPGSPTLWHNPPLESVDSSTTAGTTYKVSAGSLFFVWLLNSMETELYKYARVAQASAYGIPTSQLTDGQSFRVPTWALTVGQDGAGEMAANDEHLGKVNHTYRQYCMQARDSAGKNTISDEEWASVGLGGASMAGYDVQEIVGEQVADQNGSLFGFFMSFVNRVNPFKAEPNAALNELRKLNFAGCTGPDCKKPWHAFQIPTERYWALHFQENGIGGVGKAARIKVSEGVGLGNDPGGPLYLDRSTAPSEIAQLAGGGGSGQIGPNESRVAGQAGYVEARDQSADSTNFYPTNCYELYLVAAHTNAKFASRLQKESDIHSESSILDWTNIGFFRNAARWWHGESTGAALYEQLNRMDIEAGGDPKTLFEEGFDMVRSAVIDSGFALAEFMAAIKLEFVIAVSIAAVALIVAISMLLIPIAAAMSIIPEREDTFALALLVMVWAKLALLLQYTFLAVGVFMSSVFLAMSAASSGYGGSGYGRLFVLPMVIEFVTLIAVMGFGPFLAYIVVFSESKGLMGANPAQNISNGVRQGVSTALKAAGVAFAGAKLAGAGGGGGAATAAAGPKPSYQAQRVTQTPAPSGGGSSTVTETVRASSPKDLQSATSELGWNTSQGRELKPSAPQAPRTAKPGAGSGAGKSDPLTRGQGDNKTKK